MKFNHFADVAELADAQVSEACDGDIVEVQVLSSAPRKYENGRDLLIRPAFSMSTQLRIEIKKIDTETTALVSNVVTGVVRGKRGGIP